MHESNPPLWRRRTPEDSVLYQVMSEHLESFLRSTQSGHTEASSGLPRFVERELRKFRPEE